VCCNALAPSRVLVAVSCSVVAVCCSALAPFRVVVAVYCSVVVVLLQYIAVHWLCLKSESQLLVVVLLQCCCSVLQCTGSV